MDEAGWVWLVGYGDAANEIGFTDCWRSDGLVGARPSLAPAAPAGRLEKRLDGRTRQRSSSYCAATVRRRHFPPESYRCVFPRLQMSPTQGSPSTHSALSIRWTRDLDLKPPHTGRKLDARTAFISKAPDGSRMRDHSFTFVVKVWTKLSGVNNARKTAIERELEAVRDLLRPETSHRHNQAPMRTPGETS